MEVHTNIPLKNRTTMRLGGETRFYSEINTPDDIPLIHRRSLEQNLPIYILGGGSNTIAQDEGFAGLVLHNRILGFEIIESDAASVTIKVGGGEDWDETVKKTVDMSLTGIEAMSAVPGTVGASPVQNIGAYGQDVSEVITLVDAFDTQTQQFVQLSATDCKFKYRDSIFRSEMSGRYIITYVTMKFWRSSPKPPFYKAVEDYFNENEITFYTPQVIRDAVMKIRFAKLPDPKEKPNSGSFFKNAIIEDWLFDDLIKRFPDMPSYDMPDSMHKIPTGWLIEQAGFKGKLINGIRVHDKNCLVLINESASTYADLADAQNEITIGVQDKFRITIEREPLLLG